MATPRTPSPSAEPPPLAEAAEAGDLRSDVPPAELAQYCLHALTAAAALTSQTAVARLVAVTLDGLRPVP
ncbi:hypothetical protein [Streptomyces sp. NPDC058304]|uniref:SbtR family transcriptional regulator n=1 Tax=Streptomyces sp. NPDC058304 TaxID=3346437 RepID=UPI0036E76E29